VAHEDASSVSRKGTTEEKDSRIINVDDIFEPSNDSKAQDGAVYVQTTSHQTGVVRGALWALVVHEVKVGLSLAPAVVAKDSL